MAHRGEPKRREKKPKRYISDKKYNSASLAAIGICILAALLIYIYLFSHG